MQGICKACGQVMTVEAKTQEEADCIAMERCDCEEGKKARLKILLREKIKRICFTPESESGIPRLSEDDYYLCLELGNRILDEQIEEVNLKIKGTKIKIKIQGDVLKISRELKKRQEEVC